MFAKYAKAVLIATGAFLAFPLVVLNTGSMAAIWFVATTLVVWFAWALWRLVAMIRIRAYRADAEIGNREAWGFAAGIISATPVLFVLLALATSVRGPDQRTIAAGEYPALELALNSYHADTGSYPTGPDGLHALTKNPGVPHWAGPYMNPAAKRYFGWFDYSAKDGSPPVLTFRLRPRQSSRQP